MNNHSVDRLRGLALAWWAEARGNPWLWRGLLIAVVVILIDQLSKHWIVFQVGLPQLGKIEISQIFDLSYVENRGASFGLLEGKRWLLAVITSSVGVALVIWLGNLTRRVAAIGVGFIIGGAFGNLYDRLVYGFVVDFLDFSGVPFPNFERIPAFPFISIYNGGFIWVFNVADMAINVGVALLLLDAWQTREQPTKPELSKKS